MVYKIDYTDRNNRALHERFVKMAADKTEAVTRFMDWFFRANPDNAVRIELITAIEFTGDMAAMESLEDGMEAL